MITQKLKKNWLTNVSQTVKITGSYNLIAYVRDLADVYADN